MPVLDRKTSHIETESSRRLRALLVILPFAMFGYLLSSGDSGVSKLWDQADRIRVLQRDIARLAKENSVLAEEARLLRDDPKTIERIARERYGMVKDNESVYMVYPSLPGKQP